MVIRSFNEKMEINDIKNMQERFVNNGYDENLIKEALFYCKYDNNETEKYINKYNNKYNIE